MAWNWSWHPHPEVWALVLVLYTGYRLALRYIGPRAAPPGEPVATPAQRRSFALGLAAILVAADWPVHDLAERYLYSVHMVQHIVLTLVAPPLVLRGTPAWLARALVPPRAMRVVRALARPILALAIFNATIVITHWPTMVGWSVTNEGLHFLQHALLFGTAALMWLPVYSPVLEVPRLSYPGQMLYVFLQSLVPTVPASFLTFGSRPLYPVYDAFPRTWGISALGDMRAAGVIMKLLAGAILWGVIAVKFFQWARFERDDGADALHHRDVDRTMNRMELKS
jgi:putative membrane protein